LSGETDRRGALARMAAVFADSSTNTRQPLPKTFFSIVLIVVLNLFSRR
jgi:hypothetical protein